jgi:hypothetical protein
VAGRTRLTFARICGKTQRPNLAEENTLTGVTKSLASRAALIVALVTIAGTAAHAQWGWSSQPASPPAAPAPRGENFSAGKSAAQLFTSDCTGSGCHKSAQGLARDRGVGSLASFLREHYTNSRESAATLATYLVSLPSGRGDPKQQPRATSRPDDKPAERKPPAPTPPAAVPTPPAEAGDKPPARAQRGRQATTAPAPAPAAPTPQAPPPEPVAAPAAEPAPAAVEEPPKPAEPPKPKWDIFD